MEKSYLDLKVSFSHIVTLLVGIIIIGTILFYLGFQAGKATKNSPGAKLKGNQMDKDPKQIQVVENSISGKDNENRIDQELKLHQDPEAEPDTRTTQELEGKEIRKEPYYTIQVGAFQSHSNAKNYSDKFSQLGYQTEILSTINRDRKLFRVRVGHFDSLDEAQKVKIDLEKLEKKKFSIVQSK